MRSSKTRASGFWKLGESGYSNYMNTLYMNCNGTTQNGVEPSTENNNGTSVSLFVKNLVVLSKHAAPSIFVKIDSSIGFNFNPLGTKLTMNISRYQAYLN